MGLKLVATGNDRAFAIRDHLLPLIRGNAPKRLLVYQAAAPFAGIRRAPLEVLGSGPQFVAYTLLVAMEAEGR